MTKLRNPVEWANQQTSYHDCRVALCLAMGVPLERIDPCTGHNLTNELEREVRAGGGPRAQGGPEMSTAVTYSRAAPARVAAVDSSAPANVRPAR